MRSGILLLALCASTALPAQVQVTPPREQGGWTTTRIAKWALLGAAIGFGSYALVESGRADDHYEDLRTLCRLQPDSCRLENGQYADPTAERFYDRAAAADKRARIGIIGGQITLLGSVAFFVYDLRNGRGPDDIPYPPSRAGMAVGLSVNF